MSSSSGNAGFWTGKRVIVTGGTGFLGSHIVDSLKPQGAIVLVPRSREYNLVRMDDAVRCFQSFKPDVVIHSAAYYGGIGFNQLYPGKIFYENLVMGANVMEAARLTGVEKFVGIGTACSYPGYLEGELREQDLWNGSPHESVLNYGLTKKMMAIQGWAYRRQYGFNSIHLILTNLYGPRDTFQIERAHVVSALIKDRKANPGIPLRRGLCRGNLPRGGTLRGHYAAEYRLWRRHTHQRTGRVHP